MIMENKRTEEILNSLDGVRKAPAPDFFYTRLQARMEKELESGHASKQPVWYLKPAFITAGLLFILALNAFAFIRNNNEGTIAATDDNETEQQSIVSEYSLADNNIVYDLSQDR